jgi:NitT/TauT family transport system permease protein
MLPRLNRFFDIWVVVWLNLPALVLIVLAYMWFGLNEVRAVCAVAANKIPNVIVTLSEGARALNRQYAEMARVFRISRWRVLRHVIVPQLAPFLAAAGHSGLSQIWKIVLVVELLGRPDGVGFQIHLSFQLFYVAAILTYTMAFDPVMLAIEWGLLQPLERRAAHWRSGAAER